MGEHNGRSGQPRHQRLERRLHLEQHARAARRHQRSVTDELQRIAQPLLGMEQNRFARDGLAAGP